MKTIKRTLLSIILLQAVCQPISAISFDDVKDTAEDIAISALEHPYITAGIIAGTTLGTYYRENIKRGFNKVVNTIKTHPKKTLTASLMSLILLGALYHEETQLAFRDLKGNFLTTARWILLDSKLPINIKFLIIDYLGHTDLRIALLERLEKNS
jgi:hypothetical protein